MYGQFVREMPQKVDQDKIWQWLFKSNLKIGTETMLSTRPSKQTT